MATTGIGEGTGVTGVSLGFGGGEGGEGDWIVGVVGRRLEV